MNAARLFIASLFVVACTTSSRSQSDATSTGETTTGGGADVATGADSTSPGTDAAGSDVGGGGSDAATAGDTDTPVGEDVVVEDDTFIPPVGDVCGVLNAAGLPLGAPCTEHAQCSTGYCYDEELFNETGPIVNRFCTAKCAGCTTVGNCNEWPKAAGVEDNKCFPLTSAFINANNLSATSVCLVGCINDSDCQALGQFSVCRLLQFDGSCSYGVVKVCQPEAFAGNEMCQ